MCRSSKDDKGPRDRGGSDVGNGTAHLMIGLRGCDGMLGLARLARAVLAAYLWRETMVTIPMTRNISRTINNPNPTT